MKVTGKKKPIHTIPGGVWESSRPRSQKGKKDHPTLTTDLQGNGYPMNRSQNDATR